MRKRYIALGITAGVVLLLAVSCSHRPTQVVEVPVPVQAPVVQAAPMYAQPPVVVQQAPAHDGLLTGMMLGHMMSGGNRTTVVHSAPAPVVRNTTIINRTVVAPRPTYSPSYSSRSSSSYSSYRRGR